jgi:acetyltransferase-like isoleucine patch superfamily enzyme
MASFKNALKISYIILRYDIPLWLMGLLTNWLPDNRYVIRLRGMFFRPFIYRCGKKLAVAKGVQIKSSNRLVIGNSVYLASGVWLNAMGNITIEDEVVISPYVVISTGIHIFKNNSVNSEGGTIFKPVTIGKGTWLASHVVVNAGVKIGRGVMVGANAVVTKDIPDNTFSAGVPAKVIGPRADTTDDSQIKKSRFDSI